MGISSFVRQGNGCAGVYESGMAKGNFLSRARGARQVERLLLRSASHFDRYQWIIR
jgi:hypothetical protein